MSDVLIRFDSWLQSSETAALVIREPLVPVEGPDGVIFPPTFAADEDASKFSGGFNIDKFADGTNICIIDSVGSQANRMEPLFEQAAYRELVPQIVVVAGDRRVNLLSAGHRAADAIVRCSSLKGQLREAFLALQKGNAEPLARIAPTSLVFGAWDSRDTQAKLPRLIASTIRAFNVQPLTRSAQFNPAVDYVAAGLLDGAAHSGTKDLASRGFVHVPASNKPGGVIANGGIRRDATFHLAALRLLHDGSEGATLKLRRYVLGLGLVAFTHPGGGYLRQGCNLVPDVATRRTMVEVRADGARHDVELSVDQAREYAGVTAEAFGVGENRTAPFDSVLAERDINGDGDGAKPGKSKKK